MSNKLVEDYLKKSKIRIAALNFYKQHKDYSDVVREAQEVVELLLKAILLYVGIEIPKVHDVSKTIEKYLDFMPKIIQDNISEIKRISKSLRKEREISFYGADDFIPNEEYTLDEADKAISEAKFIYETIKKSIREAGK